MNAYDKVNERMLALLEAGTIPWQMPWESVKAHNPFTGTIYRGINAMMLPSGQAYATYNQLAENGVSVKKGCHGFAIVYAGFTDKKDKTTKAPIVNSKGKVEQAFFWKYSVVFAQTDWVMDNPSARVLRILELSKKAATRNRPTVEVAEKIINITHNKTATGEGAYYRPSTDTVNVPPASSFKSQEAYYSTYFHELGHWTGHKSRLDRLEPATFGSEKYGKEELVAELNASYLNDIAGISGTTENNSASYLENWIKAIKGDSKLLLNAFSPAKKATEYITRLAGIKVED